MLFLCSNPPAAFQLTQNKNPKFSGVVCMASADFQIASPPPPLPSLTLLSMLASLPSPIYPVNSHLTSSPLPTIFSTHMAPSPTSRFCLMRLFLTILAKNCSCLALLPSFPALHSPPEHLPHDIILSTEVSVCLMDQNVNSRILYFLLIVCSLFYPCLSRTHTGFLTINIGWMNKWINPEEWMDGTSFRESSFNKHYSYQEGIK